MFKKSTYNKELLEIVRNLENKIDIINIKMEENVELEGCCNCKQKESKIYMELTDFLESKLNIIKDSFLKIISVNCNEKLNIDIVSEINLKTTEHKNDIINTFSTIIKVLNENNVNNNKDMDIINQNVLTVNNNLTSFNENVKKNSINNNIYKLNDELLIKIDKNNDNINKNAVNLNIKLREDFQQYLISLEVNICNKLEKIINKIKIQDLVDIINILSIKIKDLMDIINVLSIKINDLYLENELIKHHFLLEEELNSYNDEIESIKNLILNTKEIVNKTMLKYNV